MVNPAALVTIFWRHDQVETLQASGLLRLLLLDDHNLIDMFGHQTS